MQNGKSDPRRDKPDSLLKTWNRSGLEKKDNITATLTRAFVVSMHITS